MKHTKGKWIIYETSCSGGDELLIGSDDQEIYPLATVNHTIEEGKANAKLISKAPEMYEVLKEIAERLDDEPMNINSKEFELWEIANNVLKEIEK